MTEPAYPAARIIAPVVEAFFARLHDSEGFQDPAPLPPKEAVQDVIDAAFWASFRREEGRSPKISIALLPPEHAGEPLMFGQRVPLGPVTLTRLAPAVERPGIHLGVWSEGESLYMWGATRTLPPYCFVLEVVQPGLLVVKFRRADEHAKFGNVVVLDGARLKVVDERTGSTAECPPLVASLLAAPGAPVHANPVSTLVQLAVSMRAHGHGGTLLIVPDGTEAWWESILPPATYPVEPAFSGLADLVCREPSEMDDPVWREAHRRAVDSIAGLTAVDGATVITDCFKLLAFGAKIGRRKGSTPVESVVTTEPVIGDVATALTLPELGGTRHSSAAQFVHDQHDALAFVASQDGRFTLFAWSSCGEYVHARRIETLLL
jgi:hypothetical protein